MNGSRILVVLKGHCMSGWEAKGGHNEHALPVKWRQFCKMFIWRTVYFIDFIVLRGTLQTNRIGRQVSHV